MNDARADDRYQVRVRLRDPLSLEKDNLVEVSLWKVGRYLIAGGFNQTPHPLDKVPLVRVWKLEYQYLCTKENWRPLADELIRSNMGILVIEQDPDAVAVEPGRISR